jgi:hypothetical protein
MDSLLALSCSRTPASSLEHTVPIPRRTPTSTHSLWSMPKWYPWCPIWCPISTAIAEQKEDGWPELIYRWGLQRSNGLSTLSSKQCTRGRGGTGKSAIIYWQKICEILYSIRWLLYVIKKSNIPQCCWCRQSPRRGFKNRGMGINKVKMNFF